TVSKIVEETKKKKKGVPKEELRDIKPDKPDPIMQPYFKIWIETFLDIAISIGITGYNKNSVKIIYIGESDEHDAASGFYDTAKNLLFVNTIKWSSQDRKKLIENIENVKKPYDFQNLSSIDLRWKQYCSYMYPSSTIPRSEEHTSELQSRGHLVCRLLLEKKKSNNTH